MALGVKAFKRCNERYSVCLGAGFIIGVVNYAQQAPAKWFGVFWCRHWTTGWWYISRCYFLLFPRRKPMDSSSLVSMILAIYSGRRFLEIKAQPVEYYV